MDQSNRSQRLFMELGTALQMEPETPDRAVSGELMGMRVGEYLIVRISDKNFEKSRLKDKEHLRVKYILSNDVFGFKTHIIRTIQNPDYLIFLGYPQDVQSCNIRAKKRVECFLPAKLILDENQFSAIIMNINKNGCLIQVEDCPELDCCRTTPVTLSLPYGQFDTLTLTGEVRTESKQGRSSKFGILFDDLDGYAKKVLSTLVPALNL